MRGIAWILIFAGWQALAAEQQPAKFPPEIQQAVGMAMSAPPEFAAEALLRLAETADVPGTALKKQLVEAAFGLAARALHPVRLTAVAGVDPDTRAGYEARALRLKLDTAKRNEMYIRMQDLMEQSGDYVFLTHEAVGCLYRSNVIPALRPDGVPYYPGFRRA